MTAKHRGPRAFIIEDGADKRHGAAAIEFTADEPPRELAVTAPAPLPAGIR